jgi:hypothetical protein
MQDAKILLDKWEVIFTSSILLLEDQEARFEILPEDPLNITIRFETIQPPEGEKVVSRIKVTGKENECVISLVNWNNILGISTTEALEIAEDDEGHVFAAMLSAKRIGKVRKVFIQVMRRKLP